jgi:hypothetical protein
MGFFLDMKNHLVELNANWKPSATSMAQLLVKGGRECHLV